MIEIIRYNDKGYQFRLKAESGLTLLNSIEFSDKEEIKKTVKDLSRIEEVPNRFERKTNHEGKFLFILKDAKGKLIGISELYNSEAGMENGIKNLKNSIASLENTPPL